ncbi:MAG: hypothetical protein MI810_06140 [Flavobacteriales bacterium]|nr:hypothetical protein [Flavobacteriales bacterium]
MDKNQLQETYNNTFAGLTMYYRDCELKADFVSKYQPFQILMERGFTDVSSFAEGLGKNLRYAIASNQARYMGQINPDVAKYGFNLIQSGAYYKVLDVYTIGDQTQVLLLHFNETYLDVFKSTTSNIEEQVIEKGRASFDQKIKLQPNPDLYDANWQQRTSFPIGMSDTGEFFL